MHSTVVKVCDVRHHVSATGSSTADLEIFLLGLSLRFQLLGSLIVANWRRWQDRASEKWLVARQVCFEGGDWVLRVSLLDVAVLWTGATLGSPASNLVKASMGRAEVMFGSLIATENLRTISHFLHLSVAEGELGNGHRLFPG